MSALEVILAVHFIEEIIIYFSQFPPYKMRPNCTVR